MNLQDERIRSACDALTLGAIADHYPQLAQQAADTDASFADFLETCLKVEQDERRSRSQTMLTKFAGFPAIKLIDDYDFKFAAGAPKKTVQMLQSMAFVERKENVIFLGPSGVGKTPRHCLGVSGNAVRGEGAVHHGRGSRVPAGEGAATGTVRSLHEKGVGCLSSRLDLGPRCQLVPNSIADLSDDSIHTFDGSIHPTFRGCTLPCEVQSAERLANCC